LFFGEVQTTLRVGKRAEKQGTENTRKRERKEIRIDDRVFFVVIFFVL
jgi:hypothetical protein